MEEEVTTSHAPEEQTAENPIDWENLDNEQIGELMNSSPEDQANEQKRRQLLWTIFAIACVLAIVLPAAWVFLGARMTATDDTQNQRVITPVNGQPNTGATSVEVTKSASAAPAHSEEATESVEIDLSQWDYYLSGKNIFAPLEGNRVKDSGGVYNAKYKSTYYDALDIYENKQRGVQVTIPVFSDDPVSVMPTDGSLPSGMINDVITTDPNVTSSRMTLDAIGTEGEKRITMWKVGSESFQAAIGEKIGTTGWTVSKIGDTTAQVVNGSKTFTVRVGGVL